MSNSVKPDTLEKRIKEILKGADLDTMSVKKVRSQLESEFKCDLNDQKKLIADIINEVINSKEKDDKNDSNDEDENDDEDEDEKDSEDDDKDDDYGKPSKSKRRAAKSTKKTKSPAKSKKPARKRKRSSDDDDDDDEDAKEAPKRGKKRGGNNSKSGYLKTCKLSDDLAALVGESELPRHQVVKKVWGYVKEKDLYDPKNKQFALCDDAMLKIFGMKRFRLFGMMKYLSKHIK